MALIHRCLIEAKKHTHTQSEAAGEWVTTQSYYREAGGARRPPLHHSAGEIVFRRALHSADPRISPLKNTTHYNTVYTLYTLYNNNAHRIYGRGIFSPGGIVPPQRQSRFQISVPGAISLTLYCVGITIL